MRFTAPRLAALAALVLLAAPALPVTSAETPAQLAASAKAVLTVHCYRCHGQDGSVEGSMNYVTDLAKLVTRKKFVPDDPKGSRLYRRVDEGTMPPPDEHCLLRNQHPTTRKAKSSGSISCRGAASTTRWRGVSSPAYRGSRRVRCRFRSSR